MFKKLMSAFFPSVKAQDDGELIDPQAELRETCKENQKIVNLYQKYQTCNNRVNSRSKTTETCTEEFFDYLHELDHCVAHDLWPRLK